MLNLKLQWLWPPDAKSQLVGKDPNAGKDWRQKEKGAAGDEMVGWHHQHNRHEYEQALGDSEGQRSLACHSPWGHKELDTNLVTENNSVLNFPEIRIGFEHVLYSKIISYLFFFWLCHVACKVLAPQPGFIPMPPVSGAWILYCWVTRKVPLCF